MRDPGDECACDECQRPTDEEWRVVIEEFHRKMHDGMVDLPDDLRRLIDDHFEELL